MRRMRSVTPGILVQFGILALAASGCGLVLGFKEPSLVEDQPGPPDAPGPPDTPDPVGTLPGPPASVVAVAKVGRIVELTWVAPASAGSAPILQYSIESSPAGVSKTTTALTYTTEPLTVGTTYTFTIRAVSSLGMGMPLTSDPVIAGDIPGQPTNVAASAALSGRVTASWSAPPSIGYPVTRYVVVRNPDGKTLTVDGATTMATFDGVTNGSMYSVAVHAVNAFGDGAAAQSSSVTGQCSSASYTLNVLDSSWVEYGIPALASGTTFRDIEPFLDKRSPSDRNTVGWMKFGLGAVPAWATITGMVVFIKVDLQDGGGVRPLLDIVYSANDAWSHGPPPPTPAQVAISQSVSTPVLGASASGMFQSFTVNTALRDWSPDIAASDRQISLGLRNTATLASGQFSFAIFFGQGAATPGDRPFIQLTTCE
jgi:predicted RNA-binding protein with TRAM domain